MACRAALPVALLLLGTAACTLTSGSDPGAALEPSNPGSSSGPDATASSLDAAGDPGLDAGNATDPEEDAESDAGTEARVDSSDAGPAAATPSDAGSDAAPPSTCTWTGKSNPAVGATLAARGGSLRVTSTKMDTSGKIASLELAQQTAGDFDVSLRVGQLTEPVGLWFGLNAVCGGVRFYNGPETLTGFRYVWMGKDGGGRSRLGTGSVVGSRLRIRRTGSMVAMTYEGAGATPHTFTQEGVQGAACSFTISVGSMAESDKPVSVELDDFVGVGAGLCSDSFSVDRAY